MAVNSAPLDPTNTSPTPFLSSSSSLNTSSGPAVTSDPLVESGRESVGQRSDAKHCLNRERQLLLLLLQGSLCSGSRGFPANYKRLSVSQKTPGAISSSSSTDIPVQVDFDGSRVATNHTNRMRRLPTHSFLPQVSLFSRVRFFDHIQRPEDMQNRWRWKR